MSYLPNVNKPVGYWIERELFWEKNRVADCLTIILRTTGCYWAKKEGCIMCGYSKEASDLVRPENILKQLEYVRENVSSVELVKIFTSGSFFDSAELSKEIRSKTYDFVEDLGSRKLIVESRPEFVQEAREAIERDFILEVGIGVESTSDFVRRMIRKGFTFEEFRKASEFLRDIGVGVKAYLLLKPPFLSEGEAIEDAISSSKNLLDDELADLISLNPTNVQSGTYVEWLWRKRLYRPPWLWSVVEVLKAVSGIGTIISDPVAAGKRRGPHNCGVCDEKVADAVRNFSLSQKRNYLEMDCDCKAWWEDYVLAERISRVPVSLSREGHPKRIP